MTGWKLYIAHYNITKYKKPHEKNDYALHNRIKLFIIPILI